MNTFERELRRMFQDSDVINNPLFFGNCMIGELNDDLKIKVFFTTGMYAENYSMLCAKIINRTEGVVDSERFVFNDILDGKPVVKGTNRLDIIHLWSYSGEVEWYGYQPNDADIRRIADAVESYASIFQSDNMTLSMQFIDSSDIVLAVWSGKPSGTSKTVEYAQEQKKTVIIIDPGTLITKTIQQFQPSGELSFGGCVCLKRK